MCRRIEDATVPRPKSRSGLSPSHGNTVTSGHGTQGGSDSAGAALSGIGQDAYARLYSKNTGNNPLSAEHFTKVERERVLELLLSQERVVSLLYAKTFPIGGKSNNSSTHALSAVDTSTAGGPSQQAQAQNTGGNTTLPYLPGISRDSED